MLPIVVADFIQSGLHAANCCYLPLQTGHSSEIPLSEEEGRLEFDDGDHLKVKKAGF
jgi:hypothetical protein